MRDYLASALDAFLFAMRRERWMPFLAILINGLRDLAATF